MPTTDGIRGGVRILLVTVAAPIDAWTFNAGMRMLKAPMLAWFWTGAEFGDIAVVPISLGSGASKRDDDRSLTAGPSVDVADVMGGVSGSRRAEDMGPVELLRESTGTELGAVGGVVRVAP